MSNISEYKINALPSKTWYWLNLNDTKVAWDSELLLAVLQQMDMLMHFMMHRVMIMQISVHRLRQAQVKQQMFYLQQIILSL